MVCLRSRGTPRGPRGPREGPRMALGGLPWASGAPGARVKKPKNPYLLQGPTERPSRDRRWLVAEPFLSDRRVVGLAQTATAVTRKVASANSAVHWQLVVGRFSANFRPNLVLVSADFRPNCFVFVLVFGRFSAKLGPKTPLERRGSSCSAGCTKNQPRRPILRPFRCNSEF